MMGTEARYKLSLHVPGAPVTGEPSVRHLSTLAGALATAWENDRSGGRSLGISLGGLPVLNEEELMRCYERLRVIEGDCPGSGGRIVCAARVLREMGLD